MSIDVIFGFEGSRWPVRPFISTLQSIWRNDVAVHGAECARSRLLQLRENCAADINKNVAGKSFSVLFVEAACHVVRPQLLLYHIRQRNGGI